MKPTLVTLAVLMMLAAGCVSNASNPSSPSDPESLSASGWGTVEGIVTDDEELPLVGARVRIMDARLETLTDEGGGFRFDSVPVGSWRVNATLPTHQESNATVHVRPDQVATVELRLTLLPSEAPYHDVDIFHGSYDCAHELIIWTGDCMIAYQAATNQSDPVTGETFAFRLPVGPGWENVVLELTWTQGGNNQLDGLRLYLENGNGTEVGHSYKVGRVEGPDQPLRLVVHRGEPHPRADTYPGTQTKAFIPDEGELAQIRVFPRGLLYDYTSQVCDQDGRCFLGVGVGVDIDFTVYATVFYHERATDAYSAVPDA